jgi:Cu-Zn family superoxide dismutase
MFDQSIIRKKRRGAGAAVAVLAIGGAVIFSPGISAQDSTPVATPKSYAESGIVNVILSDAAGDEVGSAIFTPTDGGVVHVVVQVNGTDLAAGPHGIHIHQTGICDPNGATPFESAGGHFNPNSAKHGAPVLATPGAMATQDEAHAGDLGNIMIDQNGDGRLEADNRLVMLPGGDANSLLDDDGSAIIIHQGTDDLQTDPSGNSGDRAICGVIFAPGQEGATPVVDSGSPPPASPEA